MHSGDGWGRGCVGSVLFMAVGTHGRLLSSQCVLTEAHTTTTKRPRAVHFAMQRKDAPAAAGVSA